MLEAKDPSTFILVHTMCYRNESTGNWRGVRVSEGKLQPPDGAWSETTVYNVVYPKGHSQGQYYVDVYRYLSIYGLACVMFH